MQKKNTITAYIQGGFGNQLFTYFAALNQAKRLHCELTLDISWYGLQREESSLETFRTLGLKEFLGDRALLINWQTKRTPHLQKLLHALKGEHYIEKPCGWGSINNKVKPGSRMIGYFQSFHYFRDVEDEVLLTWDNYAPTTKESLVLEEFKRRKFISAHVRRGDYLQEKVQNHHGLTSARYFESSIETLRKSLGNLPAFIFTDSPEHVAIELANISNLVIVDQSDLTEAGAIKAMSLGSSMVMSNSSFSWWSAYLMTRKKAGQVIAPKPWYANGDTPVGLLLPEWLALG